jgi:hypothetical protein
MLRWRALHPNTSTSHGSGRRPRRSCFTNADRRYDTQRQTAAELNAWLGREPAVQGFPLAVRSRWGRHALYHVIRITLSVRGTSPVVLAVRSPRRPVAHQIARRSRKRFVGLPSTFRSRFTGVLD